MIPEDEEERLLAPCGSALSLFCLLCHRRAANPLGTCSAEVEGNLRRGSSARKINFQISCDAHSQIQNRGCYYCWRWRLNVLMPSTTREIQGRLPRSPALTTTAPGSGHRLDQRRDTRPKEWLQPAQNGRWLPDQALRGQHARSPNNLRRGEPPGAPFHPDSPPSCAAWRHASSTPIPESYPDDLTPFFSSALDRRPSVRCAHTRQAAFPQRPRRPFPPSTQLACLPPSRFRSRRARKGSNFTTRKSQQQSPGSAALPRPPSPWPSSSSSRS